MSMGLDRREFLISAGSLSAAVTAGGTCLLSPTTLYAHNVTRERFCELIASITEDQTQTTSFFVIDETAETLMPDSAAFRDSSGAVSFADGTGLTFHTARSTLHFCGECLIVNGRTFNLGEHVDILNGARRTISAMVDDPRLLTTTTMMGAGALLGYLAAVQQTGLLPSGGLSLAALIVAADFAQESLTLIRSVPAADQLKSADFKEQMLAWQAMIAATAAPIQRAILASNDLCIKNAANELDLKKCQAQNEAHQKCLTAAMNHCTGMCKAFAEAPETRRGVATDACKKLIEACRP
jgi:hypothetical protein